MSKAATKLVVRDKRLEPTAISKSEALTMLADKQQFNLRQKQAEDALMKRMSPKGKLNLPKLLDERRWKYGIPDEAFHTAVGCLFDRIMVWQVPEDESETFGGGLLVKPGTVKSREEGETPRGILIGAGLQSLDALRSNGVDLGHMVHFIRLSPWRREMKPVAGVTMSSVVILRAGDLVDSEDLASAYLGGKCSIAGVPNNDGFMLHSYVDESGKTWAPGEPWKAEEY